MNQVRVKVCGLTDVASSQFCVAAGVDWIGLNFHPASSRFVDSARAAEIAAHLPDVMKAVGLFVDRRPGDVAEIAQAVGLDLIQLHGDEPAEDLEALAPWPVIRAFRISDLGSINQMDQFLRRADQLGHPPEAVLVDAYVPGHQGGTGHSIARSLLQDLPHHPRLILAGGLTPENVAERVSLVRPWMVDVASGVESSPGIKDAERVVAFVHAAQSLHKTPG